MTIILVGIMFAALIAVTIGFDEVQRRQKEREAVDED